MKRYVLMLALVAVVAAASYALTRGLMSPREEDPSSWMRREFKLSEQQLAAVEKLQADYEPICAEHCSLVMDASKKVSATPTDATARAELERLESVCFEATTQHLKQIAAQMDPEQGRRFLALMEPKVSRGSHHGPPRMK